MQALLDEYSQIFVKIMNYGLTLSSNRQSDFLDSPQFIPTFRTILETFKSQLETRSTMSEKTRYDNLLGFGKEVENKIKSARKVLTVEEQKKEENRNITATYLISRDSGFYNTIIETFIGIIKPGEKSGMHRHMNEACIYILEGKGHSVIEDQRYDWKKGDAMHIPFFAWHQHFNDGDETVRFLAAIPTELMRSLGIWKMEQKEDRS